MTPNEQAFQDFLNSSTNSELERLGEAFAALDEVLGSVPVGDDDDGDDDDGDDDDDSE